MAAYDIIWEEALQELRGVLHHFHFKTFFESRKPFFEDHGTYYFEVSSPNERELMQKKYSEKVRDALANATVTINGVPQDVSVVYMTPEEADDFRTSFAARHDSNEPYAPPSMAPETEPYLPENKEQDSETDSSARAAEETVSSLTLPRIPAQPATPSRTTSQTVARAEVQLNPAHTFDSFVVGKSNDFASAAAHAVAHAPGLVYNPLFLYGDVGLGKTHLMHAIGNEIVRAHPETRIVYVTTETFTNELIYMIQSGTRADRREEFQNKYRRADVLMIDDIQFIAGKESTQEEFFNTFNVLHSDKKQIVISSDRKPSELSQLQERMRSRFEWGLVAEIKAPDYETRLAILKKKAEERPDMLTVDEEVFQYIAEQPNANIRALEGALARLNMYASLHQAKYVDLNLARGALQDFFRDKIERVVTADQVCTAVCEYYEVSDTDLKGPRRTKNVAFARQVAMYILRKMTDMSLARIAEQFGKKDHTTVMHAEKTVTKAMEDNANVNKAVNDIIARLRNA